MRDQEEFKFKASALYLIILSICLLISTVIVILLPIALLLRLCLIAFVLLYGGHVFWKFGLLRAKSSILSIRRQDDGRWQVSTQENTYLADMKGDSTVSGIASALRFRVEGSLLPVSCIIFRDSLLPEEYRRLLVLLKLG